MTEPDQNPAGLDDSGTSPEAIAAIRAAQLVVPTYEVSPEACLHLMENGVIEIGRGFEDDEHAFTVHRCIECGTEFVTQEQA